MSVSLEPSEGVVWSGNLLSELCSEPSEGVVWKPAVGAVEGSAEGGYQILGGDAIA